MNRIGSGKSLLNLKMKGTELKYTLKDYTETEIKVKREAWQKPRPTVWHPQIPEIIRNIQRATKMDNLHNAIPIFEDMVALIENLGISYYDPRSGLGLSLDRIAVVLASIHLEYGSRLRARELVSQALKISPFEEATMGMALEVYGQTSNEEFRKEVEEIFSEGASIGLIDVKLYGSADA